MRMVGVDTAGGVAIMHQQQISTGSLNPGSRVSKIDITTSDKFPAGLRILAVDDDPTCLTILAQMLRKCSYEVTTCTRATQALSMLREKRDNYDLVISDVYMPDMDGFKLLEYVGLEMDLPVIMTSSHGETSVVMKGVTHGACDYLLKPVRIEELRNIWQHVVRKKRNEPKDVEASGSVEDNERHRRGSDDGDYTSSVNEGMDGNWKLSKRRKDEDDNDHDNDDPSTLKKQRVVWSVELHQQFVNAVNQLGIDKAVPKKILELMNVQGLTRENVASHLQKYRLYLRRLSGVQPSGGGSGFCAPSESFGSLDGLPDIRALAATGQLSQQALASIQGGLMSRGGSHVDPSMLMQIPGMQGGYYSSRPPPLMSIPARGIDLDQGSQISPRTPGDDVPGLAVLQHQFANTAGVGGISRANANGNSLMIPMQQGGAVNMAAAGLMQQQQQQNMLPNEVGIGRPSPLTTNLSTANGVAYPGLGDKVLGNVVSGGAGSYSNTFTRTLDSKSNHSSFNDVMANSSYPVALSTSSPSLATMDSFISKDLGGSYSSKNEGVMGLQNSNSSRAFGTKLASLSLQQQQPGSDSYGVLMTMPTRFAVDGIRPYCFSSNVDGMDQSTVESNFPVKLESDNFPVKLESSNHADDLFSVILKQQQQQQQQQHHHEGMSFVDGDYLM